jgi:predicted RNase H-like HicB family nuclease
VKYAVVIEKAGSNYSAYVPDLPGCVATGRTIPAVQRRIREAVELHLEGMRDDGLSVPKPSAKAGYITASVPRRRAG